LQLRAQLHEMLQGFFAEQKIQVEYKTISDPRECIETIADRFYEKHSSKLKRDYFYGYFIEPTQLGSLELAIAGNELIDETLPARQANHYCEPNEVLDKFNPKRRVHKEQLYDYLKRMGLDPSIDHDFFYHSNNYGLFKVNLQDGNTFFTPRNCLKCKKSCKKMDQYLCIVAIGPGFSTNDAIRQDEMVVLAKILGIVDNQLPEDVKQQIIRMNSCDV
jgi:hypothetical protein